MFCVLFFSFVSTGVFSFFFSFSRDYLNLTIKELNVDKWRVHIYYYYYSGWVNVEKHTTDNWIIYTIRISFILLFKLAQIKMELDQTTGFQKRRRKKKKNNTKNCWERESARRMRIFPWLVIVLYHTICMNSSREIL